MIRLAIDFSSVDSYLALAPSIELAERVGADIALVPFRSPPAPPIAQSENESVATRHRRVRQQYRWLNAQRYAAARGVELASADLTVDTVVALVGLSLANRHGRGHSFASLAFAKFWTLQVTRFGEDEVTDLLREAGVTDVDLDSALPDYESQQMELSEREVYDVPTYLVNDEMYIGRQHLPLIEHRIRTGGV